MNLAAKVKLYVLFYKKNTELKLDDLYVPLMCGNYRFKEGAGMIGDDSGDHISEKNAYFSELTGIYWMWKNTNHETVGACHYRRFYTLTEKYSNNPVLNLTKFISGKFRFKKGLIYSNDHTYWEDKLLTEEQLSEILQNYDGVLPKARVFSRTTDKQYSRHHNPHDLLVVEQILKDKCPEYLRAYNVLKQRNTLHANNMFILKQPYYDEFMKWWFEMMFEFEKRVNLQEYTGYQERILGFIAERLLNIWFIEKNLKIKELNVVYFKKFKFE
ncbi:DUF4422 domain-containing protein [Litoribacter populi]|uniref:DUF4422 domain-containing protein n=1 Tax=Litoribacter populi TaxID=2598460 RepID=UPI00163D6FC8|nr:DUF4422 domain-containing protein [Litoribacter populi]